MSDDHYNQFRVSHMGEIEFDVGSEHDETVMRIFLSSRTGDQIALEIPHEMWTEVFGALSAAMKQFPGGGLRQ
jgi:hypothetical protein